MIKIKGFVLIYDWRQPGINFEVNYLTKGYLLNFSVDQDTQTAEMNSKKENLFREITYKNTY